jgi:hypothetical protein
METEKWRRARMIGFNARIGSHIDPKHLPKSEEQFLPLPSVDRPGRMKANRDVIKEMKLEREEVLKHIKNIQ